MQLNIIKVLTAAGTKVATRKWQLGQIDESERFLGGWGDLA